MLDAPTIERIVREHSGDLEAASRAVVQAANRAGGEDNITAVLFEMAEGTAPSPEPDERTREMAQPDGDDEDTLHGEQRIEVPATDGHTPSPAIESDTMVVPAAEIEAAVSAPAPEPEAGLGRHLLALAVIVAL